MTRSPGFWLVVIALGYVALTVAVVVPDTPLGSDEALYASQLNPRVPALMFTAPRARGITYLIAPIVSITSSTVALRAYLAVLSGALLVVAYWPWLRALTRPWLVPLAALVFGSLWVTLFYGADDMPNIWVAFFAVATVGWFVRYGQDSRPGALAGVGLGMAGMALMRPSDAFWVALPLIVAMATQRRWRSPALAGAVVVGAVAGVAQWVVEAYQHFGGVASRLHQASADQGGLAWHPIGALYSLRSIAGPRLCRPCSVPTRHFGHVGTDLFTVWWFALPLLVIVGLFAARRTEEFAALAVSVACGAVIGLSYLLTVDYAAPRFLLPTYALLSVPAAAGIARVARATPTRTRRSLLLRRAAAAVVVLALAANLASQLVVLNRQVDKPGVVAADAVSLSGFDVDPGCVLAGVHRTQLAYLLGCHTATRAAHLLRYAHRQDVAYLSGRRRPPLVLVGWRRVPLWQPAGAPHWYAFVPPAQRSG
jgi:hypothetical protein